MDRVEQAVSCFEEGFNCAQALLSVYGPQLRLDHEIALKVSESFGRGMGGMGKTCGAVTGAFMVIGLKHGRIKVEDKPAKEKTYRLVKEFVVSFESRNGTIICKELLRNSAKNTPRKKKLITAKNPMAAICSKFVRDAAEIIEQIL